MRAFELNDLQNKENEEKMKLVYENRILQRELEKNKERQNQLSIELSKIQKQSIPYNKDEPKSTIKSNDPRANAQVKIQTGQPSSKSMLELQSQVISLTEKLKVTRERVKAENHRCYKYEREVLNVKENYYNKLLSKYENCESITLRHTRHTKLFKQLYEKDKESSLNLKETLDELIKYIKSREDKIAYLERKIKKKDKEVEEERAQSTSFLDEISTSSKCLLQSQNENESLRNELKELNTNFNKTFKEKNNEIQELSKEINKVKTLLSNNKNLIQSQKNLLSDIKKKVTIQESMMVNFSKLKFRMNQKK